MSSAADELHQAGADEVAHAFHVAHDARNQRAGAVFVVEATESRPRALHLAAHFGNQALAAFDSNWVIAKTT